MSGTSTIIAHPGRTFEVTLYAHGGTGTSWCLGGLSGPVMLFGQSSADVHPGLPGGAVRQVFTFVGVETGTASLSFALVRPWAPDQPYDTRAFEVTVEADVDHAMLTAAGNESFPPLVFGSCEDGAVHIESRTACTTLYNVPPDKAGDATATCLMKYAAPVRPMYNVGPGGGCGPVPPVICFYAVRPPTA